MQGYRAGFLHSRYLSVILSPAETIAKHSLGEKISVCKRRAAFQYRRKDETP